MSIPWPRSLVAAKRRWIAIALLATVLATMFVSAPGAMNAAPHDAAAFTPQTITLPNGARRTLYVATGLHLSLYAAGLTTPRFMALGPRGDVFITERDAGVLAVIVTRGGVTRVTPLLSGLAYPHGVTYHNGLLYLGETGRITVMRYDPDRVRVYDWHAIIADLPSGGRHFTRTVGFGPDGMLYVSVGSSCNVCVETDWHRAAILRYRPDGSGGQVYARGLRNAVGLAWQPGTGLLWATENGRDYLGDNAPPDELNIIRQGGNYGWPYCWGNRQPDPNVPPASGYCAGAISPTLALQAHSAPLGLTFYTGSLLPSRYRGGIFVAYHGSWNRSTPTGYKVVYVPVSGIQPGQPQDVVTGWLAGNGSGAWGRPVGLLALPDGSLLISDDTAGAVYRLS